MATSDSDTDIPVTDYPAVTLEVSQTEDGEVLFYDPTPGQDTLDGGRWIRAPPDACVDLVESN